MGDFVVMRIANFWTVVHGEVMFVKRSSPLEAIAVAVETASRASRQGGRACVVFDDPNDGLCVAWDSARDSFGKG